jgi:hypothetical protein
MLDIDIGGLLAALDLAQISQDPRLCLGGIQGGTYIGFWRALHRAQPLMILYLCLRQGRSLPPIDPTIF